MPNGDALDFELSLYTPPSGDVINFELLPVDATEFLIALGIRGKLGGVGEPDPLNVKGIYQMRMTKRGKRPIKMKFYTPTNPMTPAQQANRQKFAAAMAAWKTLTPTQQEEYNERAKRRSMFGWGLFIREYYQSN